jgi:hypothetical protein
MYMVRNVTYLEYSEEKARRRYLVRGHNQFRFIRVIWIVKWFAEKR